MPPQRNVFKWLLTTILNAAITDISTINQSKSVLTCPPSRIWPVVVSGTGWPRLKAASLVMKNLRHNEGSCDLFFSLFLKIELQKWRTSFVRLWTYSSFDCTSAYNGLNGFVFQHEVSGPLTSFIICINQQTRYLWFLTDVCFVTWYEEHNVIYSDNV